MAMGPIRLEVVCPSGAHLVEEGLDEVVFHRREDSRELGSYVSILPRHGSLLALSAAGHVTWRRGQTVGRAVAGAGVVEVLDERVLILASEVRRTR
jgi:F0F1-type ATP synthase epsilon subunit